MVEEDIKRREGSIDLNTGDGILVPASSAETLRVTVEDGIGKINIGFEIAEVVCALGAILIPGNQIFYTFVFLRSTLVLMPILGLAACKMNKEMNILQIFE